MKRRCEGRRGTYFTGGLFADSLARLLQVGRLLAARYSLDVGDDGHSAGKKIGGGQGRLYIYAIAEVLS